MILGAVCSSRRVKRESASVPPPAGIGSVPFSPTQLIATGSTSAQKTFNWSAPQWFENGTTLSGDITYTVRVATTSGGAVIGGSLAGSSTLLNSTGPLTVTGLPTTGTLYATVTATHANGESQEGEQVSWTGT